MPEKVNHSFSASDWSRLPGKSRNFVNKRTGEILSRRQFDKLSGRLQYSSYEKKAQANKAAHPRKSKQRPARGRKSTLPPSKKKKNAKKKAPTNRAKRKHGKKWDLLSKIFSKSQIGQIQPWLLGLAKKYPNPLNYFYIVMHFDAGFGPLSRTIVGQHTLDRETILFLQLGLTLEAEAAMYEIDQDKPITFHVFVALYHG